MSIVKKLLPMSVEEYLDGERQSDVRHEYVDGEIYAMVGASSAHNMLCVSLTTAFSNQLKGSGCQVFASDMKVRLNNEFYYPDVMVVCDKIDTAAYYQTEPVLIVEVLSESTKKRDRFEKRLAYQKLESLKEYALVSQDKMQIEIIRRMKADWRVETYVGNDTVCFQSISLEVSIEEIYENVL